MKKPSKKFVVVGLSIMAVALFAALAVRRRSTEPQFEFVEATPRTLVQEVSVTGQVEPAMSVELGFETSGKIAGVLAWIGKLVQNGEALVVLESGELIADLHQAEANLLSEQARLDELKRGSRPEEIQVQEVKTANARAGHSDAQRNLADVLADAYTKADDAVRYKTDEIFLTPTGPNPDLRIRVPSQLESDLESERLFLESLFQSWKAPFDAEIVRKHLERVRRFLDNAALAVNNPNYTYSESGTSVPIPDAWKTNVSSARMSVNAAIGNLTTAEEKLRSAAAALALSEEELTLKKAQTVPEQITAQEARVASAAATVQNIRARLGKTVLRSPIAGMVVAQNAKRGEIVSANTAVASVISASAFEIHAHVPEADIAKVAVGNPARVTLDAYGTKEPFEAIVAAIDPAETIIDGVTTYTVTLQFAHTSDRIKSGMTANVDIVGESRNGVLAIPARALIRRDGKELVQLLQDDGTMSEAVVDTGLRGTDGFIEITHGIAIGDSIVTYAAP